jgi:hypothetical protein
VVHVGFGSHMNDLRAKCRYRIDLGKDRAFRRMQRAKSGNGTDEPRTASPTGGSRGRR